MLNQPRRILSLDKTQETSLVKKILKSPLGLAYNLVQHLFENKFNQIKDNLDTIKQFVAGIERTEHLEEYQLARYYPHFFAYHQYFHSSYRARQGKVLEALLSDWISIANPKLKVARSKKETYDLLKSVLPDYKSKLDLDVVVANSDAILCVQLRSRDDTGGTTAKSSLVQATRYMMRQSNIAPDSHIHYVVGIWDIRTRQQEMSTKKKWYQDLEQDLQDLFIDEATFYAQVSQGIVLRPYLTLQLCYGYQDLAQVISEWANGLDINLLNKQITLIGESDDLWLAYLVAHLELESIELYGQNNIMMLNEALTKQDYSPKKLKELQTSQEHIDFANDLAQKIATEWRADFPFLHTLSEKIIYIRDLILLKFVYDSLSKS